MSPIQTLTAVLGWCVVINAGVLLVTTLFLAVGREFAIRTHARMFGLDEDAVALQYFQYLAQYKLLVIVFNLAPYLALAIVAG